MEINIIGSTKIQLSKLEVNKGQIEGLPANPRFIRDEKYRKLIKSLKDNPEMMALREILVYPHEGKYIIIGGNMRYRALKEIGENEAICKIIPESATVDDLKAYTIKDNSGFGEWDFDMLANEWDSELLADCAIDLPDIDAETEEKEVKEDEFDEESVKGETISHKGDIWKLGIHRLACGDCTDKNLIDALFDNERADITFSSPPYNMSQKGNFSKMPNPAMCNGNGGAYLEYTDDLSDADYSRLLIESLRISLEHSDDVLFNIGILAGSKTGVINMMNEFSGKFIEIMIWLKNNYMPLGAKTQYGILGHLAEPIFCFNQSGSRKFTHPQWKPGAETNVIKTENNQGNKIKEHHASFPIAFAAAIIKDFSEKSVYDCFGGSGTTLIAAEQLGRRCFMSELDPRYIDIIIARWEKFTGEKAVLLKNVSEKVSPNEIKPNTDE